jgi:quercetin dioxygenase-like cupin family protein
MKPSVPLWRAVGLIVAGLVAAFSLAAPAISEAEQNAGEAIKLAASAKLPNVPGKSVSAVVVNYAPGGKSAPHHHAGSVLAIRSENSAMGPVKAYQAGETFFEPPVSEHLVSENASITEPASLLAIFIADDGAELTTFDK